MKKYLISLLGIVGLYACQKEDLEQVQPQVTETPVAIAQIKQIQEATWIQYKEQRNEELAQSQLTHKKALGSGLLDWYGKKQSYGSETIWDLPLNERMKMKYFLKTESKEAKPLPFFLSLHGGGQDPSAKTPWGSDQINEDQWQASIQISREMPISPAFFIVPRMADDRIGVWSFSPQIHAFKKMIQLSMLSGLADTERLYLFGISQGGYGTLDLAQFMPDYFAAVSPLDAANEVTDRVNNLRNLPIRIKVGSRDHLHGRLQYAYDWEDKLKELQKANPNQYQGEVIIEEGKEHGTLNYNDVALWLKDFKRNVYPTHLTYVYHNIAPTKGDYGQFSEGVYYLDFRELKASDSKARLLVDIIKKGNHYELKTKNLSGTTSGKLSLYLDNIDWTKAVVITHNGKEVWNNTVQPSQESMTESLKLWGDPLRIFPARLSVEL